MTSHDDLLTLSKASEPWKLLQYQEDEFLLDHEVELAGILGTPLEESRENIASVLKWYHYHQSTQPPGNRTIQSFVIHLTQSFRIPSMTVRLGAALEVLRDHGSIENVLDYGGGGGKDSIIYARAGYDVTYSDFLEPLTDFVRKRFDLRNLRIQVLDVRDLPEERYSAINNMDVLEHIYDLEFSLADLIARLREGGVLICEPAFYNDWTGDHKSKNCGYAGWFDRMMCDIGMTRLPTTVRAYRRERPEKGGVCAERATLRRELYQLSRAYAKRAAYKALLKFPIRTAIASLAVFVRSPLQRRRYQESALSQIIDNLDIYRLSHHRLTFQATELDFGEPRRL